MLKLDHLHSIFLLTLISLIAKSGFSQEVYSASGDPTFYTYLSKTTFFEDDLNDNHNKWLEGAPRLSDLTSDEFANGHFYYQNDDPKRIFATAIDRPIDFTRDFEIELSARIVYSPKKYGPGGVLFWCRDTLKRTPFLYFSRVGELRFVDCTEGDWDNCKVKRRRSFVFKKGAFNKITVRKAGDYYYLFVNEKFERRVPYKPLHGSLLGLGAGPGSRVAYDYIRISYLD